MYHYLIRLLTIFLIVIQTLCKSKENLILENLGRNLQKEILSFYHNKTTLRKKKLFIPGKT